MEIHLSDAEINYAIEGAISALNSLNLIEPSFKGSERDKVNCEVNLGTIFHSRRSTRGGWFAKRWDPMLRKCDKINNAFHAPN